MLCLYILTSTSEQCALASAHAAMHSCSAGTMGTCLCMMQGRQWRAACDVPREDVAASRASGRVEGGRGEGRGGVRTAA